MNIKNPLCFVLNNVQGNPSPVKIIDAHTDAVKAIKLLPDQFSRKIRKEWLLMPFEQTELRYNRPDVVAYTLGYASSRCSRSAKR